MLETTELMELLQPAAAHLLPPVAQTKDQNSEGLCLRTAPLLCSPPCVQHTRTESILKTDFFQAPGDAPLAF